jgi:extradiol dioxygenase family protein
LSARPFHFSFHVRDLASTRRFYGELLGCREGRSTDRWVDFEFFGSQISAHLGEPSKTSDTGSVDGVAVPLPHFGAILEWDEFEALAARLTAAKVVFVIAPYLRYPGKPGEQATMFLRDFSGNALEFKAFRHPGEVFSA